MIQSALWAYQELLVGTFQIPLIIFAPKKNRRPNVLCTFESKTPTRLAPCKLQYPQPLFYRKYFLPSWGGWGGLQSWGGGQTWWKGFYLRHFTWYLLKKERPLSLSYQHLIQNNSFWVLRLRSVHQTRSLRALIFSSTSRVNLSTAQFFITFYWWLVNWTMLW